MSEERLPPAVVQKAAEEWRELKFADLNSPGVPRQVAELRKRVDDLAAWRRQIDAAAAQLAEGLRAVVERADDLLLPEASEVKCVHCGGVGQSALVLACSGCRGQQLVFPLHVDG